MEKELLISMMNDGMVQFPHLLLSHYTTLGMNEKELVLIMHVHASIQKGNPFPTPEQLASQMTISEEECTVLLRHLVQKGFLSIEDYYTSDQIRYEAYSLKPLWYQLIECHLRQNTKQNKIELTQKETDLYTVFEQEFGRPLSPIECETLAIWMDQDHHDPSIIKAALREAVMSGKLNFRYIDRILFEWKKNGIHTIEQARIYGQKFRERKKGVPLDEKRTKKLPLYNWLEQ
jgi:DNA replication protein